MTDIIERLETEASLCRTETAEDIAMLLDEAALEIGNERRRTENMRLSHDALYKDCARLISEGDSLRKELSDLDTYRIGQIEKLRAALERIIALSPAEEPGHRHPFVLAWNMANIAREALRGTERTADQPTASHADELAWCVNVAEDVAKRLDDTWPNDSLLNRCERALRWFIGEVERLEKIAYPIGRATDQTAAARPNASNFYCLHSQHNGPCGQWPECPCGRDPDLNDRAAMQTPAGPTK